MSLVRKELLPVIRKRHGWTLDECHKLNLKMVPQPIGATGAALGAVSLVHLHVSVEETGVFREIPCFVLASEEPIWGGEVANCDIILGTNALVSLGFRVTHSNGTEVHPEGHQVSVATEQQDGVAKQEAVNEGTSESVTAPIVAESEKHSDADQSSLPALRVLLDHAVRVGPQQTAVVGVRKQEPVDKVQVARGIVVPAEGELAIRNCDFTESL